MTTACAYLATATSSAWAYSPEKYAVDVRGSGRVRRIDDKAWESATPLPLGGVGGDDSDLGFDGGHLLEKSGPKWSGPGGAGPFGLQVSPDSSRASIFSWDGIIRSQYGELGEPGSGGKNQGKYWIDLYDTATGEGLIKMQGSFKYTRGIIGDARWYGSHYYVMPLGDTVFLEDSGFRHLLICDAVAERSN